MRDHYRRIGKSVVNKSYTNSCKRNAEKIFLLVKKYNFQGAVSLSPSKLERSNCWQLVKQKQPMASHKNAASYCLYPTFAYLNQELTAVCIFKNRSLFTLIKQSCELQIFLTLPHLSHSFFSFVLGRSNESHGLYLDFQWARI